MTDDIIIPISEKYRLVYTSDRGYLYDNKIYLEFLGECKASNTKIWDSDGDGIIFQDGDLPKIIEALQRLEKLLVLK